MGRPIVISILANTSGLTRGLDETRSRLQRVGDGFRRMAAPAAGAIGALGVLGKASVDSASKAQQSLGATEQVFGKYAATVIRRSNQAAQALGLSANEYRELSNVVGASLAGAGVPLREVTGLTDKLNRRAADLAATFGGTTREAIEATSSLLRGEADPIERYGVSIKQTDVNARLAAKGQDQLTGAARKQAEMQARLDLLFSKTARSQGQFRRESGTLAGAQQRLNAEVENLRAKLGTALLPVLTRVATALSGFVTWLSRNQTVAYALAGVVGALAAAILAVNAAMLANPVGLVVAGLALLVTGVVVAYRESETFRGIVQGIGEVFTGRVLPALRAVWAFITGSLVPIFQRTAAAVASNLRPILTQLAETFRSDIAPTVQRVVGKFETWWPAIKRVTTIIAQTIARNIELGSAIAGRVIPVLIRVAGFIFSRVVPAIAGMIRQTVQVISTVIRFGRALVGVVADAARFARAVVDKVGDVVRTVGALPGRAASAIGNLASTLYSEGRALVQGFINGIGSMVSSVINRVRDVVEGAKNKAKELLGINSPSRVFRGYGLQTMKGFELGIAKGGKGAQKKTKEQLKRIKEEAKRRAKEIRDYLKGIADSVNNLGSLSALGSGAGYADMDDLLAQLKARTDAAKKFAQQMAQLAKSGLSKKALRELYGMGPEQAAGAVETLLSGGKSGIREYNRLMRELAKAANQTARGAKQGLDLDEKRRRDGKGKSSTTVNITINGVVGDKVAVGRAVKLALREFERAGG